MLNDKISLLQKFYKFNIKCLNCVYIVYLLLLVHIHIRSLPPIYIYSHFIDMYLLV